MVWLCLRNIHLTPGDRKHALVLSKTLNKVKQNFDPEKITALKEQAEQDIAAEPDTVLAYFEIADGETLLPASKNTGNIVALVAATVGKTRLIDNVVIRG